ncbi:hypothetical protein HDR63_00210 [bacterium]|nr:hypothetical protein [bacterium]
MSEKEISVREWLIHSEIMDILEARYNVLKKYVEDCGYVTQNKTPGVHSDHVHKSLFIMPYPGMERNFKDLAEELGANVKAETLQIGGAPRQGFLVDMGTHYSDLALTHMVVKIVQDNKAMQRAVMAKAALMQGQQQQ